MDFLCVICWFVALLGGIVALGKFDALHIGHRQLAIQASKVGTPFLLSFVGMAEVLGWEPRYTMIFALHYLIKILQRIGIPMHTLTNMFVLL